LNIFALPLTAYFSLKKGDVFGKKPHKIKEKHNRYYLLTIAHYNFFFNFFDKLID